MRLVKLGALISAVAALLLAQAPIALGPGNPSLNIFGTWGSGAVDVFDWYCAATDSGGNCTGTQTPSGCTAGARGTCVGSGVMKGDNMHASAWFADASMLPVTTGLPLVGTLDDFTGATCSGNFMVVQLAAFSWANRQASRLYEVNCMSSFGTSPGASNTPIGWYGNCTSGGVTGQGWKNAIAFVRNGILYIPIQRDACGRSPRDATMIMSADGGKTWKNPYTLAHGGAAQADGDAPKCGASGANGVCTDASYPGSMMWPAFVTTEGTNNWMAYNYGQDGAAPNLTGDQCNPAVYTCFLLDEGTAARVLNADLPSLDPTKWQFVTGVDASGVATFSSDITARKPIMNFARDPGDYHSLTEIVRPQGVVSSPTYIPEFKSYLVAGFVYSWTPGNIVCWMSSLKPFGPYRMIGCTPSAVGGDQLSLALDYTVVSTNPPHVQVTTVSDFKSWSSNGTPYFAKWDLVLGRQRNGDAPAYTDTGLGWSGSNATTGIGRVNSGWQFTAGDIPGTFNRNGLTWAFDFFDHGGYVNGSGYPFIHDVANNSAVLYGAGIVPFTLGYQGGEGYTGGSIISDLDTTNVNAPASMQGNGTFTVAGVFRVDATSYGTTYWQTGDTSPGNASIALTGHRHTLDGLLNLEWGLGYTYRAQSAFAPTVGNWYYIEAVVTAGTPAPAVKLWVGTSGVLTDVLAGVSRVSSGGSPPQTPNVTAAPFQINALSDDGHTANASYAALLVYDHALSNLESAGLYQTLKAKMLERGITVQ